MEESLQRVVDQISEISKNIEMEIVIYDNYTNFQTVQRVQEIGNPFRERKISKGSEFPELNMENRTLESKYEKHDIYFSRSLVCLENKWYKPLFHLQTLWGTLFSYSPVELSENKDIEADIHEEPEDYIC